MRTHHSPGSRLCKSEEGEPGGEVAEAQKGKKARFGQEHEGEGGACSWGRA